jgi:PAS domain S-box-containing protein
MSDKKNELKYREIIEAAPLPMAIARISDGRILFANPSLGKLFGLSTEEMMAHSAADFYYDPADRQTLLEKLSQEGHISNYEIKAKKADGTPFWEVISIQPLVYDREQAVLTMFWDISERKKMENLLTISNRQQEAILNNIPDLAWLKDNESKFIMANEPVARTCGMRPEDLVGKTDLDLFPRELAEQYRADDREVMRTGKRKIVEEPFVDKEGI